MVALRWSSRRSDFLALLLSGAAAALAPMPVFLLAFVVLGPMHYLTEIVWLQKKSFYFSEGLIAPKWYGVLAAMLAIAVALDRLFQRGLGVWVVWVLVLLALSAWIRNRWALAALAIAALAVKLLTPGVANFFGAVVPSLVHVFVFTWFFMVSGALRARNARPALWVNPVLLLAIPLLLLWLPAHYGTQGAIWVRMERISFAPLHAYAARHLGGRFAMNGDMLADPVIAALMRVFAFTYLFHYLNWFGKAELLEWHRIPARTWAVIGTLYAAAMGLYLWNFEVGFLVVNFLSLLHVLLEFPLDFQAIRFVTGKWMSKAQPARVAVGS
jgi:hypothetical protein